MSVGYVYILSNPAYPGLLKIGFTTDDVDLRATTLSSATGVVEQFIVEYWRLTLNPNEVERALHQQFLHVRVNPKREFFEIDIDEVVEAIESLAQIPPDEYRRTPPEPKVDTRYACKRCGNRYHRNSDNRFCPKCGF